MEALAEPPVVETALEHVTVHSLADAMADLGTIRITPRGRYVYGERKHGDETPAPLKPSTTNTSLR